jgi:hypothetical protein
MGGRLPSLDTDADLLAMLLKFIASKSSVMLAGRRFIEVTVFRTYKAGFPLSQSETTISQRLVLANTTSKQTEIVHHS